MNSNSKKLIATIACVLGLGVAANSHAIVTKDINSEVVNFADLDLKKAEGQEALQKRLEKAAARVCELDKGHRNRPLSQRVASKKCYHESLLAAKEQLKLVKR